MTSPKRSRILKRTTSPHPIEAITLLLDESQTRLDTVLTRTVIACVEIGGDITMKSLEKEVRNIVEQTIDLSQEKKVHFTDFTQKEKLACIRLLSALQFSAKVWVYYDTDKNTAVAKKDAMRSTILALKRKHSKKTVSFLVEHATDYMKVVREQFMTTSPYLSLLPDLCCYVLNIKLDEAKILQNIENRELREQRKDEYKDIIRMMHEHIRLQAFHTKAHYIERARSI